MATTPMPDNSELKPNSHKYHKEVSEPRQSVEPVIEKAGNKKRKPMGKQVKEALVGDVEEVRSYLLWDVLVPAVKDTMVDLIKAFAEGIFHSNGTRGRNQYVQRNGSTSYVSYSSYSNDGYSSRGGGRRPEYGNRPMRGSYNNRYAYDFEGIVYDTRDDAEKVLDALAERTFKYGQASVADLYELSRIPSQYTDVDWGWCELSRASVERTRDGYIINLPRPERLD